MSHFLGQNTEKRSSFKLFGSKNIHICLVFLDKVSKTEREKAFLFQNLWIKIYIRLSLFSNKVLKTKGVPKKSGHRCNFHSISIYEGDVRVQIELHPFRAFPPRLFHVCARVSEGVKVQTAPARLPFPLPFPTTTFRIIHRHTSLAFFLSLSLSFSLFVFRGFLHASKRRLSYRENGGRRRKRRSGSIDSAKEIKSTLVGLFHEIEVDNLNFDEED